MSKIQLQDFVQYGRLFVLYGGLLSLDRQKIMSNYFEYNMTLQEIASEKNISRQAVLDAIDKSCEKLNEYENTLHLYQEKNKMIARLEDIRNTAKEKSQIEIEEKVEKILKDI